MTKNSRFVSAALALATLAGVSFATLPAQAAVICKTGGAVKGCVAATAPVIVTPAAPVATTTVTRAYVAPAPIARTTVARAAYIRPAPAAVTHAGVTRVTPYGVAHAGVTRVWR